MNSPLFPLNAVLCPGGKLPLRIFEPRYLDMVKTALKQDSGFVIVLLKADDKSSSAPPFYEQGTLAKIVDFDAGKDGLLQIVVQGQEAVKLSNAQRGSDDLWRADIDEIEALTEPAAAVPLPSQFQELRQVLQALVQHPAIGELNLSIDFDDSQQVGFRLTELLPLENTAKQHLFELADPISRLQKISDQLAELAS